MAFQVFDSADGSWYIHLGAASRMLCHTKKLTGNGQYMFFLDGWIAYHRVLAEFCHGAGRLQGIVSPILPSDEEENTIVGD